MAGATIVSRSVEPEGSLSARGPEAHLQDLSIAVGRLDGQVVVAVAGELDVASAPLLHRCLVDLVSDQGNRRVAVDLAGVSFIDAAGIGVLVQAHKALNGCSLSVIDPSPIARRVLEICGLADIFRILEGANT